MKDWSRRDLLKSGALVPVVNASLTAPAQSVTLPSIATQGSGTVRQNDRSPALRERLLLDFGWRFHFGHAHDPAKDFGFGGGGDMTGFQKTGSFLSPGRIAFDDGEWQTVDLPHDWAVGLPFQNDPGLASKGYYPLGRNYPETSVGWYRRVFDIPAADAGSGSS